MRSPLAEAAAIRAQRFFACWSDVLGVLLGKLTGTSRRQHSPHAGTFGERAVATSTRRVSLVH